MADMTFDVDVAAAKSNLKQFEDSLRSQNRTLAKIVSEQQKFNQQGKLMSSIIKGITADGLLVTQTIVRMGKSKERTTLTFKQSAKEIKAAAAQEVDSIHNIGKAQEQVAKAGKRLANEIKKNEADKQREINKTRKELNKAERDLASFGRSMIDIRRAAQYYVAYSMFATITKEIKDGVNAARDLQVQIALVRTVSQGDQLTQSQFTDAARRVSTRTGTPIEDVSRGFFETVQNQVAKGGSVEKFVEDAAMLAKVTGGEVIDAVNLLSSAVNAYNIPVSESADLTALFFKTIDEGRIVMSEISNTFGRTAVQGKAIGVSINELAASLAFLTKQGVLTSDAMTFMTNIMTQLQKPSEGLKAFFSSIGVSGGIEAISTFGYAGLIERMVQEVRSGNAAATDFFREIRAEKPFQAFANNMEDMRAMFATFTDKDNLQKTFDTAVDIRINIPAEQITRQFNEIRNFFIVDVGQSIVRLIAQFMDGAKAATQFLTGGKELSTVLKLILRVTRDLIVAYAAYRAVILAVEINNARLAVAEARKQVATAASTNTTKAATIATSRYSYAALAAVAAISAMELMYGNMDDNIFRTNEALEGMIDTIKAMRREAGTITKENPLKDFLKDLEEVSQAVMQVMARVRTGQEAELNRIRQGNKETVDSIGNSFKTYIDGIDRAIQSINQKISRAKTIITDTRKQVVGFNASIDSILFNVREKFATDPQRIGLLEQRIVQLRDAARTASFSPDEEVQKKSLSYIEEAFTLEQRRFELWQNLYGPNLVSTVTLEGRLNNLRREGEAIQRRIAVAKQKEIDAATKQLDLENERKRNLKDVFDRFNKFSVFTGTGQTEDKYTNQFTGKVDVASVKSDFDKIQGELLALIGDDLQTRISLEQLIGQRRKDILAEIYAFEKVQITEQAQTKLRLARKEVEERLNMERKAFEEQAKRAADLIGKVSKTDSFQNLIDQNEKRKSSAIVDALEQVKEQAKSILGKGGSILSQNDIIDSQNKALTDALKNYRDKLAEMREKGDDIGGIIVPKEKDIEEAKKAFEELAAEAQRVAASLFPDGEAVFSGTGDKPIKVSEFLEAERKTLEEIALARTKAAQAYDQQRLIQMEAQRELVDQFELFKNQNVEAGVANDALKAKVVTNFDIVTGAINKATEALRLFWLANAAGNPAGAVVGGPAQNRASGGLVFPGGPNGADTVPTWLSPGEIVVDRATSAKFKDVIFGMMSKRHMASGGLVGGGTVNVGDINVTVNESRTPTATAQQTAHLLKREIRRGNINFRR